MRKTFIHRSRGEPETLLVEGRAGSLTLVRGGETMQTKAVQLPDGRLSILLPDARQICGRVLPRGRGEVEVSTARGGCRLVLADPLHDRVDHAASALGSSDAEEEIRALMPGRVVEIAVRPGDHVEAGALLLVLEAMKMQNEIRAQRAGLVGKVDVAAGQTVDGGERLLTIQSV